VIRSVRGSRVRRAVAGSAAALLAASGLLASAGPASADTTVTLRYPVTGTTHLAAPNADVPLGPGKLTATADLTTYTVTAKLSLPNATGSFKELNAVPVTATTQFINDGPTTGTIDPNSGAVSTTSKITIRIASLTVGGIPQLIGDSCQTVTPATIQVSSQPGWSIIKGGNLAGTYTMPQFHHCLLDTLLINLTLPGPGNTITLTLGKARTVH
jgi:hypothetical protein